MIFELFQLFLGESQFHDVGLRQLVLLLDLVLHISHVLVEHILELALLVLEILECVLHLLHLGLHLLIGAFEAKIVSIELLNLGIEIIAHTLVVLHVTLDHLEQLLHIGALPV